MRTDPYVLATFDRFHLADPSFAELLRRYAPDQVDGLVYDADADVTRAYFEKWCLAEAKRIERAYNEQRDRDGDAAADSEWDRLARHVTPLVRASWQHHNPDVQMQIALFRYFYHNFKRHYCALITQCVERAEADVNASLPTRNARIALQAIDHLFSAASLDRFAQQFSITRIFKRNWHLHVGPTNSGKTYNALLRLVSARTGCYLAPLRLLAHEVWDRISRGAISPNLPARGCELRTGEEENIVDEVMANGDIVPKGITSSTIEMANFTTPMDVAVIDEIQMIGEPQRGSAWTAALLGIKAREIHLCGEATTVPLIRKLAADCGDTLTVHEYERLTPLAVAEHSLEGDLSKIRPGDCVVAFSRSAIFALKQRIEAIEQPAGAPPLKCAVAYGSLPPDVRAEQAKIFNEGVHANVMVASDAIGMGLNLKIKRIVFEACSKFNGTEMLALSASQIKQIAGRAGRYGTNADGSADGGAVTCLQEEDMPILRAALASPRADIHYAMTAPMPESSTELRALLPEVQLPGVVQDYADSPFAAAKAKGLQELEAREANLERRKSGIDDRDRRRTRGAPKNNDCRDAEEAASASASASALALATAKMYSSVFADSSLLCSVNPDHHCLGDFTQMQGLSPIVNDASSVDLYDERGKLHSSLTHAERETFIKAPCNLRDPTLIKAFQLMVQAYTKEGAVDYMDVLRKLDLTSAVSTVQSTMDEMRIVWLEEQQKSATTDGDATREPTTIELAQMLSGRTLLRAHFLMELESLHRALMLYIWFSHRFPLAFLQGHEAQEYSHKIEDAIQFTLEGMRAARGKRLQALGRDASKDSEDRRARRDARKDGYRRFKDERKRRGRGGDDAAFDDRRRPGRVQL